MSMQMQLALRQRKATDEYELARNYVVEMADGRLWHRSYRGPASEAALVAQRWLDGDPNAIRVVTEDGEILAERE